MKKKNANHTKCKSTGLSSDVLHGTDGTNKRDDAIFTQTAEQRVSSLKFMNQLKIENKIIVIILKIVHFYVTTAKKRWRNCASFTNN